jgi:hypothetical protein
MLPLLFKTSRPAMFSEPIPSSGRRPAVIYTRDGVERVGFMISKLAPVSFLPNRKNGRARHPFVRQASMVERSGSWIAGIVAE